MAAVVSYFWLGDLLEADAHGQRLLDLYDEQEHRYLADVFNQDPKTIAGVYASHAAWMQGYPDRARRILTEIDAHARRRAHPFDLGWSLLEGADLFDFLREPTVIRQRAQESERLGRENSMTFLWGCLAPMRHGVALIREGRFKEGIVPLEESLAVWDGTGGKISSPYRNSILAEGMALAGDADGALTLFEQQIAQIKQAGWSERCHYAEILRLKGWMLSVKGDLDRAEHDYLASLDWALQQQAKSWELRTSTSLARLWQSQGKRKDAYDLLAPVYEWFAEGFDTKDLVEAKALLRELKATA